MVDGLLAGLLARCVIIINPEREIVYRELVENIEQEPNYSEAMEALRQLNRT
jgi:thiol peroxidase